MKKSGTNKILIFIGLTYATSWLLAGVFYASGGRWNTRQAMLLAVAYMFIPMICAISVQKLIYREPLTEPLGISLKPNLWFLLAWLFPFAWAFTTIGVSITLPGVSYSPQMTGLIERLKGIIPPEQLVEMERQLPAVTIHPIWLSLVQGLVAGPTVNAVAGFGEELGWRGFLQRELRGMGFYRSSVIIGLIWGVWHAPLIIQGHNYPQHPIAGVFMMVGWCVLLAPLFSWVRIKAKSVIAASIIHGSLNASSGLAIMVVEGGNDLITGVTGAAGFIVLLIFNGILFLYDRFLSKDPVIKKAAA